jgi:hypothetical protein
MADAVTGLVGAAIMVFYIWLIAFKLAALPLWIACIVGIVLMIWAFWQDAWSPVLKRNSK